MSIIRGAGGAAAAGGGAAFCSRPQNAISRAAIVIAATAEPRDALVVQSLMADPVVYATRSPDHPDQAMVMPDNLTVAEGNTPTAARSAWRLWRYTGRQ